MSMRSDVYSRRKKINTVVDFNLVNIRQRYLREYYAKTGNYKKAYENLMGSIERNDSLKHNTANMRTSEIMMRYTQDTLKLHHQIVLAGQGRRHTQGCAG